MSALDEVATDYSQIDPVMKSIISDAFWAFFHNNRNYKIKIKVWFISTSVSLAQLEPLFTLLFGPDPLSA